MTLYKKVIKQLSSLKLAVVVILLIAAASSAGTIVESKFDAIAAQKLVYKTWWMYSILGLLAVNLTAVMLDRWPWKWNHAPFIAAHIGILLILAGSLLTYQYGLDGTMRFEIGQSQRFVTLPDMEVRVHSSLDGVGYTRNFQRDVDFFLNPPSKEKPFVIPLEGDNGQPADLKITGYKKYAIPQKSILAAEKKSGRQYEMLGAAVRILLKNAQTTQSQWLFQSKKDQVDTQALGLAKIVLGPAVPLAGEPENVVFLEPVSDTEIKYDLFYKDLNRKPLQGKLKEGESFNTGWMGLELSLIRYYPKAIEKWEFKDMKAPTPITTSAINVEFMGQEQWLQQNDIVRFFTDKVVYIFSYGNLRKDLGFELKLDSFEVGRYQGTMRAASYQSLVRPPDSNETVLISMNEPLKHAGFTFYQASFQEDQMGKPVASILSVNHDPGRFLKYFGSLVMSLGVVWLFYNKRRAARAKAPAQGAQV